MKSTIKITYINRNIKRNKKFKINFILDNINSLLSKIKIYYNKECEFGQNIKIIHFENIIFNKNIDFSCHNPNTLIILDNCYFNCNNIYLENGNYKIINPNFCIENNTKLDIRFCKNVEIVSNSNNINSIYIANTSDIKLNISNNVEKLVLYGSNVMLENIKNIKEYYIRCENFNENNCNIDYMNNLDNKVLIKKK